MPYLIRYVALPFVSSVVASLVATYVIIKLARSWGLLDKPGAHKQHVEATPTLGGLGVFLAFCLGVWLCGPLDTKLITVLIASLLIVAVGVLDDIRGVSANLKLLSLFIATCILWAGNIHLDILGMTGPASIITTFLWIGLIASAFNGVDNADGSAAGLAALSSLATFFISWQTWQRELAVVSLILCGACLGFLLFNFPRPRASIFLGDSGSLFLGFGISTLTILGEWSNQGWQACCIAILLVVVPLFDFLFIVIVRGLEGRYHRWDDPIRMCARDHTFHRLRFLGLGPRQALLTLSAANLLATGFAYLFIRKPQLLTPTVAAALLLSVLAIALALQRIQLPGEAYPRTEPT